MASENFEKLKAAMIRASEGAPTGIEPMRKGMEMTAMPLTAGVTGEAVAANGVSCEWQTPEGAGSGVVLYVHGGGYVAGSINSHRNLTSHLAKASGCRVLSVDYRLGPEHPHPAPVEDAVSAYSWLLDQGIDPSNIAISGDSAGGGLTVATQLAIRERGLPMPAASVPISPWVDMECKGESYQTRADVDPIVSQDLISNIVDAFLGPDGDPTDPLASPIHGDLSGLPPMLIQVGDYEALLSDSHTLAQLAEDAGVDVTLAVWPEMIHVWHGMAGMCEESDAAIAEAATFITSHLG
ncbi:MAG: alpha/beta hydrolase [Actinomycetota bacterium]|jgi:epsilon-lactone hydrolase|nr:alpha/beta hydrolase [Actinomycetota bacterium]